MTSQSGYATLQRRLARMDRERRLLMDPCRQDWRDLCALMRGRGWKWSRYLTAWVPLRAAGGRR